MSRNVEKDCWEDFWKRDETSLLSGCSETVFLVFTCSIGLFVGSIGLRKRIGDALPNGVVDGS